MTRELIIEGQHVDLAPDTDITLEYVSNLIGDIGKINLSHSYTAKLPKTARNARILDDPGRPGHESGQTRRFLSARFYRNGIDLIGPARAYILKTTPDAYEVALVWNTLEALQTLSQSPKTLNDLTGLPVLAWIGANGKTPDYTVSASGAGFAFYNSGLGPNTYPGVNAGTHPYMYLASLIQRILLYAIVPHSISEDAAARIANKAILAAPGHAPSRMQEAESGSVAGKVYLKPATVNNQTTTLLYTEDWMEGWDSVHSGGHLVQGGNDTHRVLVNLRAPAGVNLSGCKIAVAGYTLSGSIITAKEQLVEAYFKLDPLGQYYLYMDEELKLSGWPYYRIELEYSGAAVFAEFTRHNAALPLLAFNRVHESISIANDNRFPLQGNLPDIKQWDFIKACMVQFGLVPTVQNGTLHIGTYDELLASRNAYDWTDKVDMTSGAPEDMTYALGGWAQTNLITFQEDALLSFDPDAALEVEDTTLPKTRNMYELPWAASMQNTAQHYRIKDGILEDVDIAPRIFSVDIGADGGQLLYFSDSMHGQGLISAYYTRLQEVIRKPVAITANIRLHEVDLATLDLTRPVYLGQYGRYYAILKIQTSNTDLCKVELLQLP